MIEYIRNLLEIKIGIPSLVFGVVMACKVLGFSLIPYLDIITYALYVIYSLYLLKQDASFDRLSIIFLLYLPLTIIIDQPSAVFQPWQRYALFLLLMICVSPLITSERAMTFRRGLIRITLISCVAIGSISFLCYFLGINMMRNTYTGILMTDYVTNNAGTFSGITSHSMLLGPISGIGSIFSAYMALGSEQKRWIWIALAVACLGSVLFAASRSALIATLIGIIAMLWFYSDQRSKVLKQGIGVMLLCVVTYPVWNQALDGINSKNQGEIQSGLNVTSRESKWEARIDEWETSPITGIGFAAVSARDQYSFGGKIEPGSSWLAVLSMTGLVGFILFAMMYWRAVKNSLLTLTPQGALYGAVLVMLGVHMLAEGHIFSAGSYLCFCVWLSIGCATDYPYISEEEYNVDYEEELENP